MPRSDDLKDSARSRLPLSPVPSNAAEPQELPAKPSEEEYERMRRDFSRRFKEIFRGLTQAEIARRCVTTDAVVKKYIEAQGFPTTELLIQIHRATGVNIQWLLTGEGTEFVEQDVQIYSDEEVGRISRLATLHRRTFAEEVRALAMGAVELIESV